MIAQHRKVHRLVWLLLAPLLLAAVGYWSQPDQNLSPANAIAPIRWEHSAEPLGILPQPAPHSTAGK